MSPGALFRQLVAAGKPLQIIGVVNAYCALLAERAGARALYLSGSGVAAAAFGLPDLALTGADEVAGELRRLCGATALPVLVDGDTGWGSPLMVERVVHLFEAAGAAAVHFEDQPFLKRCGHRGGKEVVATGEMCERLQAAVAARRDPSFVIMARSDALAVEGLEGVIARCRAYKAAGADMLFIEGVTQLDHYTKISAATGLPLLANLTEFGVTPYWTASQVAQAGAAIALYPLTLWRLMCHSAEAGLRCLLSEGTAQSMLPLMQTRQRLYEVLDYHQYEQRADGYLAGRRRYDQDQGTPR